MDLGPALSGSRSCKKDVKSFSSFDSTEMKLDHFYLKELEIGKYNILSFILKLISVMSQGQGAVERGFSLNNPLVKNNISPQSVIAKRIAKDHMISNQVKPHNINIDKSIVLAFKGAHKKYKL